MEPSLPRVDGGFATRAVHGAARATPVEQRPLAPAIWPAVTYAAERSGQLGELLEDTSSGYVYGRYDNPTSTVLHEMVASLHGAPAAWVTASGTAAIHGTLDALRGDGAVLASTRLYGGTWALLRKMEERAGWRVDHADLQEVADLDAALGDEHTVVHLETIANPSTAVPDLTGLARRCRERGVALVVDNTFASPWLCRPVELGATAVVESATKYLGGHGDVVAGIVAGEPELIHEVREHVIELGAVLGPFDAWLVARGLQTLSLRMERASANAAALADLLGDDPRVAWLRYPGRPDHPDHARATELFTGRGHGGVLSFDLGTRQAAERFADACRVLVRAVSLGGTQSLVLHPASTSHRQLDADALAASGLGAGTLRLSVGIEDIADLEADVRAALDAATTDGGGS